MYTLWVFFGGTYLSNYVCDLMLDKKAHCDNWIADAGVCVCVCVCVWAIIHIVVCMFQVPHN